MIVLRSTVRYVGRTRVRLSDVSRRYDETRISAQRWIIVDIGLERYSGARNSSDARPQGIRSAVRTKGKFVSVTQCYLSIAGDSYAPRKVRVNTDGVGDGQGPPRPRPPFVRKPIGRRFNADRKKTKQHVPRYTTVQWVVRNYYQGIPTR